MKITINIDLRRKYPLGKGYEKARKRYHQLRQQLNYLAELQKEECKWDRIDKIAKIQVEMHFLESVINDLVQYFPREVVLELHSRWIIDKFFAKQYLMNNAESPEQAEVILSGIDREES